MLKNIGFLNTNILSPSKHIPHDLCVGLVLVNEVALYVNVCHPHRFVHMVEGSVDCVLINADFV